MTQIATDLRDTKETAKRLRFEPVSPLTATNVQDAIVQAYTAAAALIVAPTTIVNFAMSPYAVLSTDRILLVDATGGPVTINMMVSSARGGLDLVVKDDKDIAGTNAISVVRNGAELIDGLTTYPLDSNSISARFLPVAGGYDVI